MRLYVNEAKAKKQMESLHELIIKFGKDEHANKKFRSIMNNKRISFKERLRQVEKNPELKRYLEFLSGNLIEEKPLKKSTFNISFNALLTAVTVSEHKARREKMANMSCGEGVQGSHDHDVVSLINQIKTLVADEEKQHHELPLIEKLFGQKLAVGGYNKILENDQLSPIQKLDAIHAEASKLSMNERFNIGTQVHLKIESLSSGMVATAPAKKNS